MFKVSYPAVFHKEDNSFWVEFPDLDGCLTQGTSLEEAYAMSKEALGLYLDTTEDLFNTDFKTPSKLEDVIKSFPNEVVMLVEFNSLEYDKWAKSKPVKKTLSIPSWLNDEAIKHGLNFSQILQEALKDKLNLF